MVYIVLFLIINSHHPLIVQLFCFFQFDFLPIFCAQMKTFFVRVLIFCVREVIFLLMVEVFGLDGFFWLMRCVQLHRVSCYERSGTYLCWSHLTLLCSQILWWLVLEQQVKRLFSSFKVVYSSSLLWLKPASFSLVPKEFGFVRPLFLSPSLSELAVPYTSMTSCFVSCFLIPSPFWYQSLIWLMLCAAFH